MTLSSELDELEKQLDQLPLMGQKALAARGGALFTLDFVIVGAVKRSLSLGHGLIAMVNAKNMTCARAIVRMQIDTVSRLLAYTYVNDPEEMARQVIGETPISKFKSRDGHPLRDKYLIDKMTESHPWVREVYDRTSGEVHFSEKQFFASVRATNDETRTMTMVISPLDDKYPEWSWAEVVTCFKKLNSILSEILHDYVRHKNG
jgi:hypothetical protein